MTSLSPRSALELRTTSPTAPESVSLIEELWRELDALYPEVDGASFQTHDLAGARSQFVVAWQNGEPVGCGGVRSLGEDETAAEIKRMYVAPSARGSGVGRSILRQLEKLAASSGFTRICLETGQRQPAAICLYQSEGYERIPCYGRYANDAMSVCFAKALR